MGFPVLIKVSSINILRYLYNFSIMKEAPLFVLLTLSAFFVNAQNYPSNRNNNENFVVYSKVGDKSNRANPSNYRQLVKVDPLWVLEGNVPIFYERKINTKLSAEFSVGVTFKDYSYDLFRLIESQGDTVTRTYQPGYSFSGSLKFYPSNYTEALEGFYIAPEIRYRYYSSEAQKFNLSNTYVGTPSSNPNNFLQESMAFTDFKLVFGYVTYIDDVVPVEFYAGAGVRLSNLNRAYNVSDMAGNTSTQIVPEVNSRPLLSMGLKIGMGFK